MAERSISEDTRVSLPLAALAAIIVALVTAIGAFAGMVIGYTRLQDKADLSAQRIAKLEDAEAKRTAQDTQNALHFQKLDLAFDTVLERLGSIDRKLSPRSARGDDR